MQIANDQLKMTSAVAGDLTIPMAQIKKFVLADKVMVVTKNGAVAADKLSLTSADHVQLDESGKTTTIPASSVQGVYPEDGYNTRIAEDWKPLLGVGIATGYRTKVLDPGLGQRFYVTPRSYLFLYGQLYHIYSQQLYLQQLAGGGYGYNLIQWDGFHIDVQGGLLYVHDHFFSPFPSAANPTAMAGETLDFNIGDRSTFHHSLDYEPAINHVGFYQIRTDTQFTTRVRKALSFHVSLRDLYLSHIPGVNPHKNSKGALCSIL